MSAWRRVAIEKIPRLRWLIEQSDSVWVLWVELWLCFVRAHSDPIDEELIGQVYDYAAWSAASRDPNTRTAAVLRFYEHLPTKPQIRAQMAKWLSPAAFTGMGEVFRYHLCSDKAYREFVREFYEQRDRLGD